MNEKDKATTAPATPPVTPPTTSVLKFNVMKLMPLWFGISLLILIPGIIALCMGGLKLGIDFTGGSIMELKFNKVATVESVSHVLSNPKVDIKNYDKEVFNGAKISLAKDANIVYIRSKHISVEQQNATLSLLEKEYGKIGIERIESVGPAIGTELGNKSLWAVVLVLGGIMLYTTYTFRWDYAVSIIACLAHDVLSVVGIFAILGMITGKEVDTLFVTAVLGNAGYSIHDTIVVFDRIRENIGKATKGQTLFEIAEASVHQTFVRSFNTSFTVVLTLLALLIFGGETIKDFALALILGAAIGTYSSIFVASPIFVLIRSALDKNKKGKKKIAPAVSNA